MAYANIYAHTGDNRQAIAASGLDAGLVGRKRDDQANMIKLRGVYVRNRPQVAAAINAIRDKIIEDLTVDKSLIQNELLQQIKQLKEEVADKPNQRGNLIKCIEMLGKSIPGTFAERLEVHKVDKQQSLSTLVEQLKAAEIAEIESGKELLEEPQVIDGEYEEVDNDR